MFVQIFIRPYGEEVFLRYSYFLDRIERRKTRCDGTVESFLNIKIYLNPSQGQFSPILQRCRMCDTGQFDGKGDDTKGIANGSKKGKKVLPGSMIKRIICLFLLFRTYSVPFFRKDRFNNLCKLRVGFLLKMEPVIKIQLIAWCSITVKECSVHVDVLP